jgi:CheY-like chemotaxis protein
MVNAKRYDLVFMDHMMPGMDGIEAMMQIRALEGEYFKRLPIIALTANALSGMQEMFLSKGFNDYLAKPIDISKLNALIEKWVPREKRRNVSEAEVLPEPVRVPELEIEGLDVEKGLAMTGGTESAYREVLERYCRDVEERLPALGSLPAPEDMQSFVIQVHAIRSASGSIGADALSSRALLLENAGRVNDLRVIEEHLPDLRRDLSALAARIRAALEGERKAEGESDKKVSVLNKETMQRLRAALDQRDIWNIEVLLNELLAESFNHEKEVLSKISGSVLVSEFEEAVALLDSLLDAGDA